jgi:hypothetical protein
MRLILLGCINGAACPGVSPFQIPVGNRVLIRAGVRNVRGNFTNGERLTVASWDSQGNPVASDGRSITGRNLSYAYAATTHACKGATGLQAINRL